MAFDFMAAIDAVQDAVNEDAMDTMDAANAEFDAWMDTDEGRERMAHIGCEPGPGCGTACPVYVPMSDEVIAAMDSVPATRFLPPVARRLDLPASERLAINESNGVRWGSRVVA